MQSPDPGSFRDPASRVVLDDDRVLRLLDQRGYDAWKAFSTSKLFANGAGDGRIIGTRELEEAPEGAVAALEHDRVPFISYPYEWTFSMLKDAALLQLGLLEEALGEGLTLKDATPYNIQFVAGKPVFIDIGSFEPYRDGEPWIGYRQFTRQFLFPLMVHAWAGIPYQPWLRGELDGIGAKQAKSLLPRSKRIRPSVALHVSLQARMEERLSGEAVRSQLQSAGFSADLILANVRKLQKLVSDLEPDWSSGVWVEYDQCDHVHRDRAAKGDFLRKALAAHDPKRVLDLGANDGHFSEIAAESGATAIAVDGDEPVLDALYRKGAKAAIALSDLTNPSPAQGWAGRERPALVTRANPDLVIAYGLIHHLIYTASIPPSEVLSWLASFGAPVLVEFVAPEDPMIARLTANKTEDELHPGRTRADFETLVSHSFTVRDTASLGSGERILYWLEPLTA